MRDRGGFFETRMGMTQTAGSNGWRALQSPRTLWGYAAAAVGVAAMTGAIHFIPGASRLANLSMLYLLVVIGTALRFGSGPAVGAAFLAFLAIDLFFVQPLYRFTVADPAEWLALLMFLMTAVIIGHLTARLRDRVEEARRREQETAALAEASWAVASQTNRDRALAEVLRRLTDVVGTAAAAIVVRGEGGRPELVAPTFGGYPGGEPGAAVPDFAAGSAGRAVEFVLEQGRPIAWEEDDRHWQKALGGADQPAAIYLPLMMEHRVLGVLYLEPRPGQIVTPEARRVVESLANHAAVALERDRLARAETQSRALAEADRLKTTLLAMVSHDFRSPLASIKASVTGLLQEGSPWDRETQQELLRGIDHETDRLNRMVANILALSRLEADAWRPQCELTPTAELVGAALDTLSAEDNRRIQVRLAPDLTELWLDPVQIVQVLHNLMDNALKYSPPESQVELRAARHGETLIIEVMDRGPGLPPGDEERVFERFYRAPNLRESASPGVGIGLAVCRGLVEAHGGQLTAANRQGGGAVFRLRLPPAS